MKQFLNTIGTVELDRTEITQAIREFLDRKGLTLRKALYKIENNTVSLVKVDVSQETKGTPNILLSQHYKKGAKLNIGIFAALKRYIEFHRQKNNTTIKFDELYELVKTEFPHMDENKLRIYIRDPRQLQGIKYDNSRRIVELV
jgi:hypothetical protein